MTDNLTIKQEQQLYDHIEERLQDMSHQDLLEVAREKLIDFYFLSLSNLFGLCKPFF